MSDFTGVRFQLRTASKADFEKTNRILLAGEPAFEYDTGEYKIGNGYQPYLSLPYYTNKQAMVDYIDQLFAELDIDQRGPQGPPGPLGPAGPPGPAGPAGSNESTGVGFFEHIQSPAAASWVIPHTLGRDPVSVQVLVDGIPGDEWQTVFTVPGAVVTLGFDVVISGKARLI